MRGRGTRAGMTVGVFLALGVLMTGCAWWGGAPKESLHERAARIEPALLAVHGITGGELTVTNASVSHLYSCTLTSNAPDVPALKKTLTHVLMTLAERADDRPGSLVSCSVSNGTDGVATQDLGLTSPTSLREIREKLG